jgi:hypothetical protein
MLSISAETMTMDVLGESVVHERLVLTDFSVTEGLFDKSRRRLRFL